MQPGLHKGPQLNVRFHSLPKLCSLLEAKENACYFMFFLFFFSFLIHFCC